MLSAPARPQVSWPSEIVSTSMESLVASSKCMELETKMVVAKVGLRPLDVRRLENWMMGFKCPWVG